MTSSNLRLPSVNALSFQLTSLTEVSAVPEPSTDLMLASGFAVVAAGLFMRKRRSHSDILAAAA